MDFCITALETRQSLLFVHFHFSTTLIHSRPLFAFLMDTGQFSKYEITFVLKCEGLPIAGSILLLNFFSKSTKDMHWFLGELSFGER